MAAGSIVERAVGGVVVDARWGVVWCGGRWSGGRGWVGVGRSDSMLAISIRVCGWAGIPMR